MRPNDLRISCGLSGRRAYKPTFHCAAQGALWRRGASRPIRPVGCMRGLGRSAPGLDDAEQGKCVSGCSHRSTSQNSHPIRSFVLPMRQLRVMVKLRQIKFGRVHVPSHDRGEHGSRPGPQRCNEVLMPAADHQEDESGRRSYIQGDVPERSLTSAKIRKGTYQPNAGEHHDVEDCPPRYRSQVSLDCSRQRDVRLERPNGSRISCGDSSACALSNVP